MGFGVLAALAALVLTAHGLDRGWIGHLERLVHDPAVFVWTGDRPNRQMNDPPISVRIDQLAVDVERPAPSLGVRELGRVQGRGCADFPASRFPFAQFTHMARLIGIGLCADRSVCLRVFPQHNAYPSGYAGRGVSGIDRDNRDLGAESWSKVGELSSGDVDSRAHLLPVEFLQMGKVGIRGPGLGLGSRAQLVHRVSLGFGVRRELVGFSALKTGGGVQIGLERNKAFSLSAAVVRPRCLRIMSHWRTDAPS
jgi:hypothetical protein